MITLAISIVPIAIYAQNSIPVNGQNFMDTARHSVAQSCTKNNFETTVLKALPPVFPVPMGGEKSGEDVRQ